MWYLIYYGFQIYIFLDDVLLQFRAEKYLDIISVKRNTKTKKNVLQEVNKLYTEKVNCKKGGLFSNMQINVLNPQEIMIELTVTLLPHQILIMPALYKDKIVDLDAQEENFMFHENNDLEASIRNTSFISLSSNDKALEKEFIEQKEDSFITTTDLIYMYFNDPVCGIGWQREKVRNFIQSPSFDINSCKKKLLITINVEELASFPRIVRITNDIDEDDDDEEDEPEYHYYADFAVLSLPSGGFQTSTLTMDFDSVDYNWFAGGQSVTNEEYANALESRVEKIYRESWICQYFDFKPKCEEDIVFFYDKSKRLTVDTNRFQVYEYIPANSRPYFLPKSDWDTASDDEGNVFCKTNFLSNVLHGFKAIPCYSTKSLFYTAPFFLVFRTSPSVNANYFIFNNFLKPNTETTILAMLMYNETDDVFVPQFLPEITLTYLKNLSLNNVLEFKLFDTNFQQVKIADSSQLFVNLALIE